MQCRGTVRTLSTILATAVASAAFVLPAATSTPAVAGVYQSPGLSSGKTLSGAVVVGGAPAAKAFGTWRKAPLTAIVAYSGTDSWNSFTNVAGEGLVGYWNGL